MCSVSGVVILNESNYLAIEDKFWRILINASERGRDSFGVVTFDRDGNIRKVKSTGVPKITKIFSDNTSVVIANNRAEPTTERIDYKTEEDIQPFEGERYVVSHNGVIANDKELEKEFMIERKTKIDSAVIPGLLDKRWDGQLKTLPSVLDNIKGSFALAIADKKRPDRVFLAQNFKPIYIAYDFKLGAIFFSSLDSFFEYSPLDKVNITRNRPYTAVEISNKPTLNTVDLPPPKGKKALVICSGGLDSTVAATYLLRQGYQVSLLHFNYKHKAQEKEREAVINVANFLGVPVMEMNTDLFKLIGSTALIDGEITKAGKGEAGAEFAHEWVPARNLVFISIAIALAEARGYDVVATGINLEEAGAYPDNEMEFVRLLNDVIPYAVGPNKHVELVMPVGHLVKHEIVKLGLELGAPLHLTWSCYEGKEKHCGECGPCYMRKKAFQINGVKDPVDYLS
ncbi:7-cyano-7-deazaguanine synthase [Sulfolobales archaeon HS-7]|nr:7-cyano-7-deazaguanine synthase [Sulfolobales archaeon HS-7]